MHTLGVIEMWKCRRIEANDVDTEDAVENKQKKKQCWSLEIVEKESNSLGHWLLRLQDA